MFGGRSFCRKMDICRRIIDLQTSSKSIKVFIMKQIKFYLPITIILVLSYACQSPSPLFQENMDSWIMKGDANWTFANNELIGSIESGSGFVMTQQRFKDFELTLEFNPDSTINSGVFIRCKDYAISPVDCYEMNIWDLHPKQEYRTGAIVMKSTPLAKVETIGQWNTYEIKNKNNRMQVKINGILMADLHDEALPEGYIGLQAAGAGVIRFRNVKIKAL